MDTVLARLDGDPVPVLSRKISTRPMANERILEVGMFSIMRFVLNHLNPL
jgi:hypothetical protein